MAFLTGWEGLLIDGQTVAPAKSPNWRDLAVSRQDPLLQFDWNVSITGPDNIAIAASHIEEIQVPLPKFDADSVTYQGRKFYFAKFEDFGATTVKFYMDNRLSALQIIRQWQQKIKSDKGNYRVPSAYKGKIIVIPCDTTQAPIASMTLHGVFPTQVPNMSFTSTGDRITSDIEFSVDRVETIFYNQPKW